MEKSKFFKNLTGQIEIFGEIAWKKQNFSEICLEKSKYCWPGSTTPQISNQIDAAARYSTFGALESNQIFVYCRKK